MIPILSTTGTLTGQGLGRLTEALSCVVTHEVNGEYELRMTYPVTGERYADIAENLVVWAEPDNLTPAQAFRIYRITRPLNGIVTIYARHIAYDMSGIVVKPFTASTLTNALAAISPNSSPSCPFTITSTRTVATQMKVSVPTVLWGLLGGQSGSFLDIYGGEWDFNNYTAELKTTLGTDRGVTVRYGKNLTKLEQDVTIEATYAGVFPFWYDEESGVLVKLTGDYISIPGATGSRLLLLDFSDEWETAPTEVQLQNRANAYITANDPGTPKISWKVNMAMLSQSEEFANLAILEQVMLGDTIHVYYEPMNLTASARAVKLEYDVLLERYTTVTLGRVKQNMAQIVAAEKKETAQNFKTMKSTLEKAIDSATDFITNGAGYMRFIYNSSDELQEIVSLDNADISQAQSVWRWNNGGFGHSSTGYAGPYTLAITQNGAIVADFITAGTMAGNRVRTGLLEDETSTNYWNLDTGEFHLEALGDFGGRNLIQNTLEPSVATAADYPKIVGGQDSTVGGTASTATHGIRTTAASNGAWLQIGFGGASDMNGLIAGRTYTFSCDLECKMLSGLTSGSYNFNLWTYVNGSNDTNYRIVAIDTTNSGTVIKMPVSITFTVPSNATAFRFFIRCQSSTATYALANDYFELANIKLERGSVATAWSPAPEDQVGNDEIISKINVSPEVVQISAAKVNLTGYVTMTNLSTSGQTTINGANITTGLIQDAANKNSWNLNTGAFTITQGSINIVTSSATYDQIVLQNGNFTSANRASGLNVTYTSGADTFVSGFGSGGFNVQKNGDTVISTSVGSLETLFTVGDANGTNPGLIHLYGSQKHSIFGSYAGLQIQSLSNANDRLILDFDTSTNDGCLQFCKSAASGLPVMELLNTGLKFYNTSGNLTATYPADPTSFLKDNGLSVASLKDCTSETASTSGTTKTYTLTNGTYLITTAKYNNSSTANDGVWLASVYTGGTSHLSALLAPTGTTTVSISGATLTVVTGTNNERITITHLNF